MKTQIKHLINGSKYVIRDNEDLKYKNATHNISYDIVGSSYKEREFISNKLFEENPKEMKVEVRGIPLTLKCEQSISGKTRCWVSELSERDYLQIIGEDKPTTSQQSRYIIQIEHSCEVHIYSFKRLSENSQWKPSRSFVLDESFVTILE